MSIIVEQLLIIFCTFVSSNRYSAEYHTIIIMGALHYSNHLWEVQTRYSGSAKRPSYVCGRCSRWDSTALL